MTEKAYEVADAIAEPGGMALDPGRPIARRAVLLAVGCGSVYVLIAGGFRFDFKQTEYAHHLLMTDAMLHGQLHIREEMLRPIIERGRREAEADLERYQRETGEILPPEQAEAGIESWIMHRTLHDWARVDGKVYGYWAPLAPILMIPFVAVFGIGVSDMLLNALFGGLNVGLFYWLLRRVDRAGLLPMNETCRLGLTVLLAFGTVHFYLSCCGRVWFAAQVITLTAVLAALITTCASAGSPRRYLGSGIFFGLAILGRNVVGLIGLFFLVLIWMQTRVGPGRRMRRFTEAAGWFCAPVLLAVVLQGVYNHARFGNVFDSGLSHQMRTHGDLRFREDLERYGPFSLHYLPRNLRHYFLSLSMPRLPDGRLGFDPDGNSMFLVTPPLLYALSAWRRRTRFTLALVCGVGPLLAALLLYLATGYYQFGNRYLLEMLPLLLMLVAGGMGGRLSRVGALLIVLAIGVNLAGTYWYYEG
ncbi:MAG: hypothetical protein V2A79_13250 [Planctomycetota bacterium]